MIRRFRTVVNQVEDVAAAASATAAFSALRRDRLVEQSEISFSFTKGNIPSSKGNIIIQKREYFSLLLLKRGKLNTFFLPKIENLQYLASVSKPLIFGQLIPINFGESQRSCFPFFHQFGLFHTKKNLNFRLPIVSYQQSQFVNNADRGKCDKAALKKCLHPLRLVHTGADSAVDGWIAIEIYKNSYLCVDAVHFGICRLPLRLIHITAFSACVCGRWLRFCRENFLSLHWRSPLWKTQTTASSVNQPLQFQSRGVYAYLNGELAQHLPM